MAASVMPSPTIATTAWAYSHAMMRMSLRRSFVVPTPAQAAAYPYTTQERQIIEMWNAKIMRGTGRQVADELDRRQARTGADELMLLNLGHAPEAIHRSTELIADAYHMPTLTTHDEPLAAAGARPDH